MLLTAIVGLGTVMSVGTGAGTIKQISAGLGRANREEVEQVVRSSLAIAFVVGSLLATVIILVFMLGSDLLFHRMGESTVITLTGAIAALLVLIDQMDNVFAAALKGGEQFGRAARLEIAGKTFQIVASVIAVMVWNTLAALYASLITVAAVRLIAKSWATKRFLGLS